MMFQCKLKLGISYDNHSLINSLHDDTVTINRTLHKAYKLLMSKEMNFLYLIEFYIH
jgi:hypothetical protein